MLFGGPQSDTIHGRPGDDRVFAYFGRGTLELGGGG